MTPTDRLSGFGTGLATNSDSGARVPRGQNQLYSDVRAVLINLVSVAWLPETVARWVGVPSSRVSKARRYARDTSIIGIIGAPDMYTKMRATYPNSIQRRKGSP